MKKLITLMLFVICFSFHSYSQVNTYFYPIASGTTNNLTFFSSLNTSNYIITGANGTLLRSTNAGLTNWNSVPLGTTNNLNGILLKNSISNNTNIIFGNNGTIYTSTNSGTNWVSQNSNVTSQLNAGILVLSDSVQQYKYLIVGNNGTIIYKLFVPGTGAWILLSGVTTVNLKTVYSVGKIVWTGGSGGTILKSVNAGMNWTPLVTNTSSDINSIYFANSSEGFAVGNNGLILKTGNGGNSWTQISGGTSQSLNQIISTMSGSLWIMGNGGVVLRTTNSGINWQNDIYAPNVNFNTGIYLNNFLYVAGEGGKIYKRSLDTIFHNLDPTTLNGNNISSLFAKRGIFDKDIRITNKAGFEWPKGSGHTALFTAGLTIGAKVNGELRMVAASFNGEYSPGYCINGSPYKDWRFKYYKFTKGIDTRESWDWINWGLMVPFGAPFIDVNNNGVFEAAIDTPGVKNAKETIFYCMTDADSSYHSAGEGFGGGIKPLGAEVHMTAWVYDYPEFLNDVQFIGFDIINKSPYTWNSVQMGIVSDPDVGDPNDDYIGCDTNLNLGFCYNGDNDDVQYGIAPPAVGFTILRGNLNRSVTPNVRLNMTSFDFFVGASTSLVPCESDPNGEPYSAYLMLSGYKKDSTCWLNPKFNPPLKTKFCYTGDPETNVGWNEEQGSIKNCGKDSTGSLIAPNPVGDRRMTLGSGAKNFNIVSGESQKFVIAQLIARGSNNKNSVTRLKELTESVRNFYLTTFPIGINQISSSVPDKYNLFQNYPNPFNPTTNIKYQIPKNGLVTLKVYDVLGREVETLVNEIQQAGVYETQFPGSSNISLASGIYFYKLTAGDFTAVKRMILIK